MSNKLNETIYQVMELGLKENIIQNHTEDAVMDGRLVTVDNNTMINFGSCAYLGLEHHPDLKKGVSDTVEKLGVQFSSSRSYISLGLIKKVEDELRNIFNQPLIITPSTTMGHLAVMPVVVDDEDVVILDMQVHTSVQMAAQLLKARGVDIKVIRHNDMEALEKKVQSLRAGHRKIWYMADGVYSMYGDYAPLERIRALMERYPELNLYIDDAHGMGWKGDHGAGYVRSQMAHHPRMVMATSLNKSFSAAGGCMVFPDEAMRKKVLLCGATLTFSGPIQPPMLGAAMASALLHQTPEIIQRQQHLAELIGYMNASLAEKGIPQVEVNDSPIFFIPVGLPRLITPLVRKLKADGFWINSAAFPAAPMKRGGLRFMVNGHLNTDDIERLTQRILVHYHALLAEEGLTERQIARNFDIDPFTLKPLAYDQVATVAMLSQPDICQSHDVTLSKTLQVRHMRSIYETDADQWDALHAGQGTLSHRILTTLEAVFSTGEQPENRWDFHYCQVLDAQQKPVLSTLYTTVLIKDDMLAPVAVSAEIELLRQSDPYYLNSKVVMLGSMITKGEHLYLDRDHPQWKEALALLIEQMQETAHEVKATQIMLREFYGHPDEELKAAMLNSGFTALRLPDNMEISQMNWDSEEDYLQSLSARYRSDLKREMIRHEDRFHVVTDKPVTEAELQQCYQLYSNVFDRSLDINVHKLPLDYFRGISTHPGFDVLRLYLKDEAAKGAAAGITSDEPVAVLFSSFEQGTYHAMIAGLDYRISQEFGVYKQVLYQTVKRAIQLKATRLDLAFTAELVKKKVGARPVPAWAFLQMIDSYNFQIIDAMSHSGAGIHHRAGMGSASQAALA